MKFSLHAKLLVFDRDLAIVLGDRDRHLAAGKEAGGLAGKRREIGLGKRAGQPLVLQAHE